MDQLRTALRWIVYSAIGLAYLGAGLTRSWAEGLPSELPGLARDVTAQVRESHPDALLFKILVEGKKNAESTSTDYPVWLYLFSPAEQLLIQVFGTEIWRSTERPLYEAVEKRGPIPIPSFSVDLPQAVHAANGMTAFAGQLAQGELSVKVPVGRLPVLVWTLQSTVVTTPPRSFFVDALTGASLTMQQVAGPIGVADPQLQASEDALGKALRREAKRSPGDASLWLQFVVKPILDANNIFECNALGGAWTLLRMCMP
jgi:hypothetical protein